VGIKLSKADLKALQKDIDKAIETSMKNTFIFFKKTTPIDTGNARGKTSYDQSTLTITGAYPYAGRLDTGYSKQAPKGMTQPSLVFLRGQLQTEFGKI
jgi:hypothetical protein|tara:strand:- start:2386 stop:2679 length:294 start_codon:yes stop_codon:yes gene_type:complete